MGRVVIRFVAIAAVLTLPWTVVRLGVAEGTPTASPGASPQASPVASPVAGEVAVSIVDFGFEPAQIEVTMGTTVTWTNDGEVIHTTTSKDGLWDSTIMDSGDTFSYTFDAPGTFEYWCTLHPRMLGTIVVVDR